MNPSIFKLEEYLGQYEFKAPHLLCCSDAESITMQELVQMSSTNSMNAWSNLKLGYTEVKGFPLLREQISQSFYPNLSASNILCFSGAEEGIFCALYALCEPNDHVIALTPCYQSLTEIPLLKGASVTKVTLREENNWRIDLQEIQAALKPNTKCIVINFPHNPTGQVINKTELQGLVDICRAHNLWLFSDEVYRLLGNPQEGWAPSAVELYEKALSLNVMSKSFGLAGLRVGWIACQNNDLLKKIEQMKYYTSICNSAPSEILSLIALENKDKILARNNQIVEQNLKLLDRFMNQYQDLFSWVRPQGGCVGFVRYKKEESIDDFSKRLVDAKGVLLMPASIYSHQSNHFRIGFGRKNMPESLEKLKEFLEK